MAQDSTAAPPSLNANWRKAAGSLPPQSCVRLQAAASGQRAGASVGGPGQSGYRPAALPRRHLARAMGAALRAGRVPSVRGPAAAPANRRKAPCRLLTCYHSPASPRSRPTVPLSMNSMNSLHSALVPQPLPQGQGMLPLSSNYPSGTIGHAPVLWNHIGSKRPLAGVLLRRLPAQLRQRLPGAQQALQQLHPPLALQGVASNYVAQHPGIHLGAQQAGGSRSG